MPASSGKKATTSQCSQLSISKFFVSKRQKHNHHRRRADDGGDAADDANTDGSGRGKQHQEQNRPQNEVIDLFTSSDDDDGGLEEEKGTKNNDGGGCELVGIASSSESSNDAEKEKHEELVCDSLSNDSKLREEARADDYDDRSISNGSTNLFERFAFHRAAPVGENGSTTNHPSSDRSAAVANVMGPADFASSTGGSYRELSARSGPSSAAAGVAAAKKRKKVEKAKNKDDNWVKMVDHPKSERDRIVKKWHSLIALEDGSDNRSDHHQDDSGNDGIIDEAPLEDARFRMLVAARLHAKCRDGTVKEAMGRLQDALDGREVNVHSLSNASADAVAAAISNLQYHTTKAKHLVKAAKEIRTLFNGVVPEKEHDLLKITGIGPVFADLLAYVNTREMHRSMHNTDTEAEMI